MRLLHRNLKEFEYLPWLGTETDLNEDGEHTGEYRPVNYGEPVKYRGNISMPSSRTNQMFYGMDIRYTHVLVMDDPDADIQETGLIRWKGHLYDIKAVRPSLNLLSIALRRQTEDHADDEPEEPETPVEPEDPDGDEP